MVNDDTEVMMEYTRNQLKEMLGLSDGTGVFLTNSEQDASYIPILIA
jgi:hypothetical protein